MSHLCEKNPHHTEVGVIVSKVWLIGRSYSAQIERGGRRLAPNLKGDRFHTHRVGPMIRNAPVDEWIEAAKDEPLGNHERALFAHKSLTNLFSEISGKKHQSLASKYLHFHAKEKFYIFDSRARVTLRTLGNLPKTEKLCEAENDKLGNMLGRKLTPRELDKILLAYELKNQ